MELDDSLSHYGQNTKPSSDAGNTSESNPMWDEYESLPHTKVIKIMRQVLPQDAKISDGAVEIIQKCVSEFIGFITGAAIEHSQRDKRVTISAEDLLSVMEGMGFDDYVRPLTLFLDRYHYRNHSMQLGVANDGMPLSPPLPQSEIFDKTSLDKFYEDGVGDVKGY